MNTPSGIKHWGWVFLLLVCTSPPGFSAQNPLHNLLRNADFDESFILGQPGRGWLAANPGSNLRNGVELKAGIDGGHGHVLEIPPEAKMTWYNCHQIVRGLHPGDSGIFSVYIRTENVRDGAGAYAGMNYFDRTGKRISWTDTAQKVTGTTDWTRVSQPFSVPAGTERVVLQLVVHGHGRAVFDRPQVERGKQLTAWQPGPGAQPAQPLPPKAELHPSRRPAIGIFRDDIPATGTPSDPATLRKWTIEAGYACAYFDTDLLNRPEALNPDNVSVLILPVGASFPIAAAGALKRFCRNGGNLFVFGGYPFDRMLTRRHGRWINTDDVPPDQSELRVLFDLSGGPKGWTISGWNIPPHPAPAGRGRNGACLLLETPSLTAWLTAHSPAIEGLPPTSQATTFYARADQDDTTISFEWDEADGSRWRKQVTLTRTWRLYGIRHRDLEYWRDNPSKNRGGVSDRFQPQQARHISFGLTREFLPPGKAYRVSIDRICTGPDPYPRYPDSLVNSHYGTPTSATFLATPPDAFSICDAGAPLTSVTRLRAHPQQIVLPANWTMPAAATGFSATGQTAMGQPGSGLKARWVPLVDAVDRFGRRRGTALALMHHVAGEYAGSTWAYSGIDNLDLFRRDNRTGELLFKAILGQLVRPAFLFAAECRPRCLRRGESFALDLGIANGAHSPRSFQLTITLTQDAKQLYRKVETLTIPGQRARITSRDISLGKNAKPGLILARCELSADGKPLDRCETGLVLWRESAPASAAPLAYRNNVFRRRDIPRLLLGSQLYWGNLTSSGTDPVHWDEQLRLMADNGIHIARCFMWASWMKDINAPTNLRRNDAILQLAAAHGINLFYSGLSWPSTDPDRIHAEATDAAAIARRYRHLPGWFVDIVNEPSLPVDGGQSDAEQFRRYLKQRYQTFEALRQAWGRELTEPSLNQVKPRPLEGTWASLRAVDTQRFYSLAMRSWSGETAKAIHGVDPHRPVSVGYLQGFGTGRVLWDPIEGSLDLDFANRHFYGEQRRYAAELKQTDLRLLGKAPSTGEFGSTSHPGMKAHSNYETESAAQRRFYATVRSGFGLGAAFICSWHWQDPIEDIFPCGLFLADGTPRARWPVFRNSGLFFHYLQPHYRTPELCFVIPTSHRFGMSRRAVEGAMNRTINALDSLHTEFGVVPEEWISHLPTSIRALIWPVPYCPEDATFDAVTAFVRRGGHLYVSGDLSYDGERRRTRTRRLTTLCGVRFLHPSFPDIQWQRLPAQTLEFLAPEVLPDLAGITLQARPCLQVETVGADCIAKAGNSPTLLLNHLGRGSVLYNVDPVELHDDPRPYLAAFLRHAGLARHALTPDRPDLHSFRIPGRNKALAQILLNESEQQLTARVNDLPVPMEWDLAQGWGGGAIFNPAGRLVAIEGKRVVADGIPLVSADVTVDLIALGGDDLPRASGWMLLAYGAGTVDIPLLRGREIWMSIGEIHRGQWREYERRKLDSAPLELDADMARSILLLGPAETLPRLGKRLARQLH